MTHILKGKRRHVGLRLLVGARGQPGVRQRLRVTAPMHDNILQRDAVLRIHLKEAVEEVLGKIAQTLVGLVVLGVLARQNLLLQLVAPLREGEAPRESSVKEKKSGNMA